MNDKSPHDRVDEIENLAIAGLRRLCNSDTKRAFGVSSLADSHDKRKLPFPHLWWGTFLPPSIADQALSWLETVHIWKREQSDIHLYDSFNLSDIHMPGVVGGIVSTRFLGRVRRSLEEVLQVGLSSVVRVQVHRLLPGHVIGEHTDAQALEVRVAVVLCRSRPALTGGELILFASPNEHQQRRAYPPLHNHAVGFQTGTATPHAVSQVHNGARFSLIYRFGLAFQKLKNEERYQ